jgi:hypothetical protein
MAMNEQPTGKELWTDCFYFAFIAAAPPALIASGPDLSSYS